MTKSMHIAPINAQDHEPIPVTFYLSSEILDDDGITADTLASLLRPDLAFAISQYRQSRAGVGGG